MGSLFYWIIMKSISLLLYLFLSFNLLAAEAEVVRIKGEVFVGEKKLELGDDLEEGQIVEIKDKSSFVQLKFEDGSLVLHKSGQLELRKMKPKTTLLKLIKGKVFIYKNKAIKSRLNIKTRHAVFAVRGTKFFVEDAFDAYLCVCEGTVAVKNKTGVMDVNAGEDTHVTYTQMMKKFKSNDMMNKMLFKAFDEMGVPVLSSETPAQ